MMTIECPNCSKRLKAPDAAIGKKAKCAGCGHTFVLASGLPPNVENEQKRGPDRPTFVAALPSSRRKLNPWFVVLASIGGVGILFMLVAGAGAYFLLRTAAAPAEKGTPSTVPVGPQKTPTQKDDAFADLRHLSRQELKVQYQAVLETLRTEEAKCNQLESEVAQQSTQYSSTEIAAGLQENTPPELMGAYKRSELNGRPLRESQIEQLPESEQASAKAKDADEDARFAAFKSKFSKDEGAKIERKQSEWVVLHTDAGALLRLQRDKVQRLRDRRDAIKSLLGDE